MDWDLTVWRRQSIRARNYDYSRACAYMVTIDIEQRWPLLADIVGEKSVLKPAGQMVAREWMDLPRRFAGIQLDAFVVMPDHFHGIVLMGKTQGVYHVPDDVPETQPWTLGNIVGAFKSLTTRGYVDGINNQGFPRYIKRLWQRNYYDGIIGTDSDLARARIYIQNNPAKWAQKKINVTGTPP